MKVCPYCAENIQNEALKCRYCGEWLDDRPPDKGETGMVGNVYPAYGYGWSYEYKSEAELFGWPLVHIAQGINPKTGMPHIAKGILAIGNIAIGVFALGGFSAGVIAFGGLSVGGFAIGGVSFGFLAALGGVAVGGYLALGGVAFSLAYAIGGFAIAPHYLGGNGVDPEFLQMLESWFPGFQL